MAIGRTNAGGGGDFTKSVIIVTAPTGSTVTCTKGTTVKTATEKNGEWWFKGLDTGTWTLKATLSGQTATQTVNITQFDVYRVAMSYFKSTIKVTYPAGSTCTCSKDGEVLTAPNTSGSYTFTVTSAGDWTISSDGKSAVVTITASGQSKSVNLRVFYLFKEGSGTTEGYKVKNAAGTYAGEITADYIEFSTRVDVGGQIYVDPKIDLSIYNTLYVELQCSDRYAASYSLSVGVRTYTPSSHEDTGGFVASSGGVYPTTRTTLSVDLINVSQELYVSINAFGVMGKAFNIWLEQ